jgi:zinc transport system substrate-binding protein
MDPTRLAAVAAAFEEQLADADPDNAATYADNLAALRSDLEELDTELMTGLEDCAIDTVVVSHEAFGYFGERYGLDMHAINGLSPDAEPSPAHLRELADLIREEGITTVFSETLATTALADTLASELDLETGVLDPIEGLGEATAEEDYLSLMRSNLSALQQANDCS